MNMHLVPFVLAGLSIGFAKEPTVVRPGTRVFDFENPSGTDPSTLVCDFAFASDVQYLGEVGVVSISPNPVGNIRADGTVHVLPATLVDGELLVEGAPDIGQLLIDIPGIELKQVPFMLIPGEGWYCATLLVSELKERRK